VGDLHRLTAAGAARLVRSGELTATEIVTHHLERAEASQQALNAFTSLDPEGALSRAAAVDQIVVGGEDPGPLAGVPVALKDLVDQRGLPTTAGSSFYSAVAAADSPVVERLVSAGAIVIGRTGLHEFAYGFTSENPWFGPVRNPWDLSTSPGGSSGGSGAAVAAGLAVVSVGTDTGGSVRVPAAMCGVWGLKVTHGAVPLSGVFPLAPSLDTVGPLARSAADLALMLKAIEGWHPDDPWSRPRPTNGRREATRLRIGVPRQWLGSAPIHHSVRKDFAAACEALAAEGHDVIEVDAPFLEPPALMAELHGPEAAAVHEPWFGDPDKRYGDDVRSRLEAAFALNRSEHLRARAWRAGLRTKSALLFEEVDALATPTCGIARKVIGQDLVEVASGDVHHRPPLWWFTSLVNALGAPAVAIPLGGLPGVPPPSLQLIGPPWSEMLLLAAAASLEEAGVAGFRSPQDW
jgi:Asp-tRNA(Asn)/Glu-tRNA(Gln) amidotransferase A subunit family amidase